MDNVQEFVRGQGNKDQDDATKLQAVVGLGGMLGNSWSTIATSMIGQSASYGSSRGLMNTLLSEYSPGILKHLSPEEGKMLFDGLQSTDTNLKIIYERQKVAGQMIELESKAIIRNILIEEKRYKEQTRPPVEYAQMKLMMEMQKLRLDIVAKADEVRKNSEAIMTERSKRLLDTQKGLESTVSALGERVETTKQFVDTYMALFGLEAPVKLAANRRDIDLQFSKSLPAKFEEDKKTVAYVIKFLKGPRVSETSDWKVVMNSLQGFIAANKIDSGMRGEIMSWLATFEQGINAKDPANPDAPVDIKGNIQRAVAGLEDYINRGPESYVQTIKKFYTAWEEDRKAGGANGATITNQINSFTNTVLFPKTRALWQSYAMQQMDIDRRVIETRKAIDADPRIKAMMDESYQALMDQGPITDFIQQVIIPKSFELASLSEQSGLTNIGEEMTKAEKQRQQVEFQNAQRGIQQIQQGYMAPPQPVTPPPPPGPGQPPVQVQPQAAAPAPEMAAAPSQWSPQNIPAPSLPQFAQAAPPQPTVAGG